MRASITSGTAEPRSTTSGRPIGGPAICAAASKSSRPWTTPPHGSGWTAFSSASSPTPMPGVSPPTAPTPGARASLVPRVPHLIRRREAELLVPRTPVRRGVQHHALDAARPAPPQQLPQERGGNPAAPPRPLGEYVHDQTLRSAHQARVPGRGSRQQLAQLQPRPTHDLAPGLGQPGDIAAVRNRGGEVRARRFDQRVAQVVAQLAHVPEHVGAMAREHARVRGRRPADREPFTARDAPPTAAALAAPAPTRPRSRCHPRGAAAPVLEGRCGDARLGIRPREYARRGRAAPAYCAARRRAGGPPRGGARAAPPPPPVAGATSVGPRHGGDRRRGGWASRSC